MIGSDHGEVSLSDQDRSRRGHLKPAIIVSSVVLPEPDGADDRHEFPSLDIQVNWLDGADIAYRFSIPAVSKSVRSNRTPVVVESIVVEAPVTGAARSLSCRSDLMTCSSQALRFDAPKLCKSFTLAFVLHQKIRVSTRIGEKMTDGFAISGRGMQAPSLGMPLMSR